MKFFISFLCISLSLFSTTKRWNKEASGNWNTAIQPPDMGDCMVLNNQNFLVGLSLIGGWNSTKETRSVDFGKIDRKAHHRQHGWEIAPQIDLGGQYEMKYQDYKRPLDSINNL